MPLIKPWKSKLYSLTKCKNYIPSLSLKKSISKLFSIIIFRPDQNLFTLEAILSMCAVEATHLRSPPIFKELCESKGPADCCPGWSLGGYIAVLHKRSSCFSLEVRIIYILKLQSIIEKHYNISRNKTI